MQGLLAGKTYHTFIMVGCFPPGEDSADSTPYIPEVLYDIGIIFHVASGIRNVQKLCSTMHYIFTHSTGQKQLLHISMLETTGDNVRKLGVLSSSCSCISKAYLADTKNS